MIKLSYLKYTRNRIHFTSRYQNGIIEYIDAITSKKYTIKILSRKSSFKNYKKYFRDSSFKFAERGTRYYFESDECVDNYTPESFNEGKRYFEPTGIALIGKINRRITPLSLFKASLHSYNMTQVRR